MRNVNTVEGNVNSRPLSHGIVRRTHVVLLAVAGTSNTTIAEGVGLSHQTVCQRPQRFPRQGAGRLHDKVRMGRTRSILDEEVAEFVPEPLQIRLENGTHWTIRAFACATGLSRPTTHRFWRAIGLKPNPQRHFKLSTDPFFVKKGSGIAGLCLNPPDRVMVLCVDEKSRIRALDRTRPMLPVGPGHVEAVTSGYVRHGRTTLSAAPDIATGKVLTSCKIRHRCHEYLQFHKQVDENETPDLQIHLAVDNHATHKHPMGKRWLSAHTRFQVHVPPAYSSWLNQVEIWLNIITRRALRRGAFKSVKALVERVEQSVTRYYPTSQPFVSIVTGCFASTG